MPTRFSSFNFKKDGPQHLKNNITIALLCKNLLKSDTYTQTLAKAIAQSAMTGTDVNITADGQDALTSINGKSGLDPSGTALVGDDICVAYCDDTGTPEVILVLDATDRALTNETGDSVDIPAGQHFSRETTSVS